MLPAPATLIGMGRRKADYPIAAKLVQLRRQRGWTQMDVATKIGRAQSRIAKWELSEGQPGPGDLLALANAFGVPIVYLCDDKMTEPKQAETTPAMSEDETLILGLIRRIGTDRAIDLLVAQPRNHSDPGDSLTPRGPKGK